MIDLSVSIVNYNSATHLQKCLSSLMRHTKDISCELFVVDNASIDGSTEMLNRNFPQVKLLKNEENLFFTRAHNQVLKQVQGRYCVLLNPDTYFEENVFKKCVSFMDEHPEIGVLGPKILNPNGTFQGSGDRFPTFLYGLFELLLLHTLWPSNPVRSYRIQKGWQRNSSQSVDSVSGAFFLVRSSLLSKVGLLDENFLMYWEEVDWCKRIAKAGHKIFFLSETSIVHIGSQSADLLGRSKKEKIFYESLLVYYGKYYGNKVAFLFNILLKIYTIPALRVLRFLKNFQV